MMIFQVTYKMRPGKREEFLRMVQETGFLDAVRGEDGCLSYRYYLPAEEDNTLVLLERWRDLPAQKAHLATPHMIRLGQVKDEYFADVEILSYPLD